MTVRLGDPATFAVDVGEIVPPGMRVVDLWVAGEQLTVDDNTALISSLSWYMRLDAQEVRQGNIAPHPFPGREPEETFRLLDADKTEFRERFWFMRWTEIVDNVLVYAYVDDDLVIVFKFWRDDHPFPEQLGKVFVARIPPERFVAIVDDVVALLEADSVQ